MSGEPPSLYRGTGCFLKQPVSFWFINELCPQRKLLQSKEFHCNTKQKCWWDICEEAFIRQTNANHWSRLPGPCLLAESDNNNQIPLALCPHKFIEGLILEPVHHILWADPNELMKSCYGAKTL